MSIGGMVDEMRRILDEEFAEDFRADPAQAIDKRTDRLMENARSVSMA